MKIIKRVDNMLGSITMYRLVLYCLLFIFTTALGFSFFGLLPFQPIELIISAAFIMAVSVFSNAVFAMIFKVPTNIDSIYIIGLILALIIAPSNPLQNLLFLSWVSILAMSSKYIFAFRKRHIFNPAAIALVLISIASGHSGSWWIANPYLVPFVLVGGFLIVRKIKRFYMVAVFFGVSLLTGIFFTLLNGQDILLNLEKALLYSPILFFAFVMLTEPMTIPQTRALRIIYAVITGIFYAPQFHLGTFYFTPEMALVLGNVFAFAVSRGPKLILTLERKENVARDVYDFIFKKPDTGFNFKPGQYMEWTLEHPGQDNRGIRRFLTIASSPTENDIRLGVKFYDNPSTYKKFLNLAHQGQQVVASQLSGEFTLPADKSKKLVFIAGGIGITPFRSIIKYLLDKKEKRSIIFYYLNKTSEDIAYKDVLNTAARELGIKVIYSIVDIPESSYYESILKEVPGYKERHFYISGPHKMVESFEKNLRKLGIKKSHIRTDYFPGFA